MFSYALFIILLGFINSFALGPDIFVVTVEIVKLYIKTVLDRWCYRFRKNFKMRQ
jgi:hypothetical protein